MRKASGLRNRARSGRGSYSRNAKAKIADRYGRFQNGERKTPDVIGKYVRNVEMISGD